MSTAPVLVDAFAGGGGFWLSSVADGLTPPVSWMGGKRRLARALLALLDLRPGCRLPLILGDSSWWGWVWPTVLDAETGPRVSEILRGWRGEDPRALWFRLRDMGPITYDVAGATAQLLWLQARAASGVPVWWEGGEVVSMDGHGREPRLIATTHGNGQPPGAPYVAGCKGPALLASDGRNVPREAGQRTNREDRLVQWAEDGTTRENAGKGYHGGGADGSRGGGIVDPGTIAGRLDAIRASARLVKGSGGEAGFGYDDGVRRGKGWRLFEPGDVAARLDDIRAGVEGVPVIVEHIGARDLAERWAPELRRRGLVYLDPPYQGATGYPSTCPRAEVLAIAEIWARHGARVVLSEAVGLAADLGAGWSQVELTQGRKPEWATVYGCDVRAVLPPLLRMGAA